ncbi:MAG: cell division protein FtsA [Terriglobales bacterium]
MPNHEPNFITAIDVGSAKTGVLVAELSDSGLRYRGHGIAESRGLRKGVIAELDKATASIQKAVERAEDVAGIAIEHALIGIAGAHIRGINSHGGIGFGARSREIGREEIRQAVDKARAIPLPGDREILHLLPQEFILDGQGGVHDPMGMMCTRLEVRLHIVTAASNATQNLVTAVNRAGVQVDDTIFEPLACADSVLRPEERELGVCLADLGAGSCDLIVFQQGAVAHTAVIPVGGDHFTSDLSVGMCTALGDAEMLKKNFGNAVPTLIPEGNEVEVPAVGDRPSRMMAQRVMGEILEPRARELFELVRDNLRHAGVLEHCVAGLVLTGGASRLPGILDVAESVLRKAARLAWPTPLPKMPSFMAEPEFATVLGLAYYGHRACLARGLQAPGFASRMKALFLRKGA